MSRHDPRISLAQMRDHAVEALALAAALTRSTLDSDRLRALALVRLLEIIGESANRVPTEFQSAHGVIDWRGWIGLRHRLIHGYDVVDHDILWKIVTTDLPALRTTLDQILAC